MSRTYLSVLTKEKWLENKLVSTINSTNYSNGYIGSSEQEFIEYLKNNSSFAPHYLQGLHDNK